MILLSLFLSVLAVTLGTFIFVSCAPTFGGKSNVARMDRIKNSPNYKNGKFQNLIETTIQAQDGSFSSTMKEYLFGGEKRVPDSIVPFTKLTRLELNYRNQDEVKVTWLGHSSVLISFEGHIFLTDPMFGKRASPVSFIGPKQFNDELPLSINDFEKIDAILISHDHFDHLDYFTIKQLHSKTEKFYVALGVGAHLEKWGVTAGKIVELDWWENSSFNADIELISTPARHFSGRGLGDRNETLWCSWIIKSSRHTVYFGGDSGYSPTFKEIGNKYGPFDLTMLECGAYNQAWPYVHMMPEETAQAHIDLQGKVLLPIHWAKFNLSLHSWTEPIERLMKKAEQEKIELTTPKIGESFEVNGDVVKKDWWKSVE